MGRRLADYEPIIIEIPTGSYTRYRFKPITCLTSKTFAILYKIIRLIFINFKKIFLLLTTCLINKLLSLVLTFILLFLIYLLIKYFNISITFEKLLHAGLWIINMDRTMEKDSESIKEIFKNETSKLDLFFRHLRA